MYEYTGIYVPGIMYEVLRIWVAGCYQVHTYLAYRITYVRIVFCGLIPGTAAAFQVFWLTCSNSNEEQAFRRDRS